MSRLMVHFLICYECSGSWCENNSSLIKLVATRKKIRAVWGWVSLQALEGLKCEFCHLWWLQVVVTGPRGSIGNPQGSSDPCWSVILVQCLSRLEMFMILILPRERLVLVTTPDLSCRSDYVPKYPRDFCTVPVCGWTATISKPHEQHRFECRLQRLPAYMYGGLMLE